jgi:HAMP domain-containing protein
MSTRLRKIERFSTDIVDNREILRVLTSFKNGDFSVRMPVDATGIAGKIYDALNEVIESNDRLARELERVGNLVGKEGKINHRAAMPGATGSWATCIDSVNMLATDLIQPTVDVSRVIGAIAQGDLSQRMPLEIEALSAVCFFKP